MGTYSRSVYVNASEPVEIKMAVGKVRRSYLFYQNKSLNDVYHQQGTPGDAQNGTTLGAGLFYERDRAVPQGTLWLRGSVAAPARQEVSVEEEFA